MNSTTISMYSIKTFSIFVLYKRTYKSINNILKLSNIFSWTAIWMTNYVLTTRDSYFLNALPDEKKITTSYVLLYRTIYRKKSTTKCLFFRFFLFSFNSMTYCVQVVLGTHVLRIVRFPYEHHNIFIYNSYNRNVDTRDFETFYSNINVENRLIYEFFFLRKHTVYLHCVSMVRIER